MSSTNDIFGSIKYYIINSRNEKIILITFSQLSSSELSLHSDIPLHICEGCIH